MAHIDGDWEVLTNPSFDRGSDRRVGVPCAARPSTEYRHYDGPCECFFGGPPPEYPPAQLAPRWDVCAEPARLLAS
ncbi:hypothetical protein [Cellulomonas sp. KRMCY2]|uniref:hypothetical protein n=1 Tax=Cellulomonas sp. KRMCY2 TaxID=1304865 RepID=UPI00045EBD94|nr:hypothetical protein [Cellulomonas sp. KRMCY2]